MFALLLECGLEFRVRVEVIFDGAFTAAGDEHEVLGTGGERFFHGVLDEWLIHHWQHFLRARLGGGKKTGAAAGHGEDSGANNSGHGFILKRNRNMIPTITLQLRDRPPPTGN